MKNETIQAKQTCVVAHVWHVKDLVSIGQRSLSSQIAWGECAIDFPKNYELVAEAKVSVDAPAVPVQILEEAFRLTNNIDSSWVENEGVTLVSDMRGGRRSTSMGDVVSVAGIAYVCAPMGWQQIVSAGQKIVRGAL